MITLRTETEIMEDWKGATSEPLVSICCQAYNHERYIQKAMNGFLMQKTTCPFEILIHDDASTDSTASIIQSYEKKYPNIVKPVYQKENQYSQGRKIMLAYQYPRARGQYIAPCEGDDYWTDEFKLQKQVDLLESNPGISMCFHSVMIHNINDNHIYPEREAQNRSYSIDELLLNRIAHTASFLYRKSLINLHLLNHRFIFGADIILTLIMAEAGRVFGMKDCMAVYRIHDGGVTSIARAKRGIEHEKRLMKQYIFVKNSFKSLAPKTVNARIVDHCATIFAYYQKQKKWIAIKYLLLVIYYNPRIILKTISKVIHRKRKS